MCPSFWKLYLDDFPFFCSSLAHLEPELELFEVCDDEMMLMMICRTIISQTSNSSSSSKIRITWDRLGHQKHD